MSETKPGYIPDTTKENKESGPKITVDFFFSAHGTDEDFRRFPEALKNTDVYVPETVGWTKKDEQLINQVSQGKIKLQTPIASADEIEISSLYDTKIPVILVDIPKGHALIKKDRDASIKMGDALENFVLGNFDEAVKIKKESAAETASAIKAREDFIANQLKKELKTLTKKFPQLKNKPDIRVLITLGAIHTSLYQKLKPELPDSRMLLGESTIVFGTNNEILKKLIRNPQEIIDDNTYAKALLENFIAQSFLVKISNNSSKALWAGRKLAADLTIDQIRSFSKAVGDLFSPMNIVQSDEVRTRKLIKKLKEIGINLPTTEAEIDELINLKKKTT